MIFRRNILFVYRKAIQFLTYGLNWNLRFGFKITIKKSNLNYRKYKAKTSFFDIITNVTMLLVLI